MKQTKERMNEKIIWMGQNENQTVSNEYGEVKRKKKISERNKYLAHFNNFFLFYFEKKFLIHTNNFFYIIPMIFLPENYYY